MKSWNIDPVTGDYVMVNGKPEETNSLTVPAYIRLAVPRKNWMYAPNVNYGSDFHLLRKRHTPQDATGIENTVLRALKPLIEDRRAIRITADATVQARYAVGVEIEIVDASGDPETLEFDPVE